MIPDAESILTAYLAAQTGKRIVGETPSDLGAAWVRLTLLDASNEANSRPEHLIDNLLQLECYAGSGPDGQEEARGLAVDVRAALADLSGPVDDAVVTAVRFAGMARVPDVALEPARQRYILTVHVYMHGVG